MTAIILLTFFVFIVAVFILINLVKSTNGRLRKILIGYFCVELLMFGTALYFEINTDFSDIVRSAFYLILIPKAIVKGFFFFYFGKK